MRILHSSDWHLGQNFMGKSRAEEHRAFFTWLLQQIDLYHVDAVLVVGDIFDTGSPASYARELYNCFIVDMQKRRCELIILGGNHDSVATLNESKALLACLNTHLISGVAKRIEEHIIPLKNRHGDIGAIICAIPFLHKRDVLRSQAGQTGRQKQAAMQSAISDFYKNCYQYALNLRDQYQLDIPIIMTGHLVTVGASTTDSVRDIYIGTLDAFPANAFPPADYIALGHIHQAQKVAKSEHIRYCGSPLPLGFDEAQRNKAKSVLLVDFAEAKLAQVQTLDIPCFQAMQIIKGDFSSIEAQLKQLADSFNHTNTNDQQTLWLEVIISSQEYLKDLHHRLQQLIVDTPLEILRLRRERKLSITHLNIQEKETLNELTPSEVFERRLLSENSNTTDKHPAEQQYLHTLFKQILNELHEVKTHENS